MANPDTTPVRRFSGGKRQKKLTSARARELLQVLAESANVSHAAMTVGVGRRTVYDRIASDPEFAKGFEEAIEKSTDALVAEARRRALEGYEKPVFYKGAECGQIREFSDTLLIFRLKALAPNKYRDNIAVEANLNVNWQFTIGTGYQEDKIVEGASEVVE